MAAADVRNARVQCGDQLFWQGHCLGRPSQDLAKIAVRMPRRSAVCVYPGLLALAASHRGRQHALPPTGVGGLLCETSAVSRFGVGESCLTSQRFNCSTVDVEYHAVWG